MEMAFEWFCSSLTTNWKWTIMSGTLSAVVSISCCNSGFSSKLWLPHLTASVAPVQPTSKTSAPRWSTPPVEQTSVQSIAVTCSSREPRHNSADEASVLLLQLSGTVLLFRFTCAHHPSVEDNSELGWKPISSTKPTPASENYLFLSKNKYWHFIAIYSQSINYVIFNLHVVAVQWKPTILPRTLIHIC